LRAIFGDKAGDVKDASLKAPPSLNGIVIDKKLFVRSFKDKRRRSQDKVDLENLNSKYEEILNDIKGVLIEKLFSVVNGKTCQGVYNDLGEEILQKGKKYTQKILQNIDDLEKLNPKIDGVRIGHSVGTKKRKEIVIKSIEKKFKIFNARVSERASKS